jgi:hypothetical protein
LKNDIENILVNDDFKRNNNNNNNKQIINLTENEINKINEIIINTNYHTTTEEENEISNFSGFICKKMLKHFKKNSLITKYINFLHQKDKEELIFDFQYKFDFFKEENENLNDNEESVLDFKNSMYLTVATKQFNLFIFNIMKILNIYFLKMEFLHENRNNIDEINYNFFLNDKNTKNNFLCCFKDIKEKEDSEGN